MNIIVCVKQVPDTTDIKWTKNNTLNRSEMDSVINPFDEYAIETALRIKDNLKDTKILALSMGPIQTKDALAQALSCGCNDAALICDKRFSASDTVTTSNTIASAIKAKFQQFDLIICGQYAVDGDTAQTGPGIAEKLNIPQVTYVRKILEIANDFVIVEKETDFGLESLKVNLPALICVQKCDYELRKAKINGFIYSQDKEIQKITLDDINIGEDSVGMKGSPTLVNKAFRPDVKRKIKYIDELGLVEILKRGVIK